MITKAISIRAPWWWFILHGGKDVENRDWPTSFRGTVYVHASSWWSLQAIAEDSADAMQMRDDAVAMLRTPASGAGCTYRQMRDAGGCIVGSIDIVGCVEQSNSPWFFGRYGFVLANAVAYETPVPCKGALGFFAVPDNVRARIRAVGLGAVEHSREQMVQFMRRDSPALQSLFVEGEG